MKMLPDGAESLTESDDEKLAAMLKAHVPNMDARVLWAAIMLRDKAQELGIPCLAYGGGRNKLPTVEKGKTWLQLQLKFCQKHLEK